MSSHMETELVTVPELVGLASKKMLVPAILTSWRHSFMQPAYILLVLVREAPSTGADRVRIE
jgi:hypothetical protein